MLSQICTLGIDLGKRIFHLIGTNHIGAIVLKKRLARRELLAFIANLPSCVIGIEACGGSNYWAREFQALGLPGRWVAAVDIAP